jgi:opacity protein-like surface antigen
MSRLAFKLLAGIALAALIPPQMALAQQKAPPAAIPAITPELTSGISVGEEYLDNVYAARTDKKTDWITLINPFANLRFRGDKGEFNIGGNATIGRYGHFTDENYDDYSAYANGRYNFSPALSFNGGTGYDHLHEARSSPNSRPGVTPTVYNVTRAFGAALLKLDESSVRIGGTFDHYNYDNVAQVGGGTINNDDRDRDVATIGTRVGHSISKTDELFGMFSYDSRDYRLPVDDFGFQKNSNGVRFSGGWHHEISSTLDGEVYAGGIYQRYSDPRFDTVFVPDFGGRLTWTGIPNTTITTKLERTIQESDLQGVSGYLETAASLDVIHWIRPDLRVNGGGSYYLDQFNGMTSRVDQVQSYALGIRKYFTPYLYLGVDFSRTTRDSTDLDFSYIESKALIRAGIVQEPAYKDADFKKPEVPNDVQGRFYVGFQTGLTNLGTKLQGPRGNGGTLQADFADEGWSNGLFAGYGIYLGDWYLALEGDVSKASGGWDHTHVPNERIFSVSRDYEYGLSGVIGRSFKGGTMLYGKAGVVAARFETDYQLQPFGTQDQRTEPGIRVGIGGTAPLTPELGVRLEHTYSAFNSYDIDCCIVPPGGAPDNFTNDETMTSLGLVYTFGGVPGAMKSANIDYRGFYAGGQVGHDALSTWSTGPREAGTTLTANFGDLGYTAGLFGGYGAQFANFYLGGELEAELGKTHNDHERIGGGQSFSVEKQWSYGASARVGYVANNTALLYGRIGFVETRFQLDYARGSNSLSAQDTKTGLRVGGGMEFPASNNLIVRLDYTHTEYPEFSLITPPTQDLQQFKPKEDLFRIGVLAQFGPK